MIVEESQEGGGTCARKTGRLLHELFEFGGLTAGQVMVPRVRIAGIPIGATPDAIRPIVAANRHNRYAGSTKTISTTSSEWST